jgi:hypothetical protein
LNGSELAGATSAVLTIANVEIADGGAYDVVVRDDIREIVSQPATLVILGKPVIRQQPQSQTLVQGQTALFTVVAEGTQPFSYRWRKNGATYLWPGGANFSLTNVVFTNAGQYDVVITNAAGSGPLSARAYLIVVEPPTNQTVMPGGEVRLRAVVSQPANSFTNRAWWLRNGSVLRSETNVSAAGRGLFTNELVLANVSRADSGAYSLLMSNAIVTTNVTVVTNPVPTTNYVVTTNLVGAPAVFTALLQVGAPDRDWDGMPDAWELAHGLNPDVNDAWLDADGDGMANLAEFWAGTSPTDAASVLKVVPSRSNGWVILEFLAVSNQAYGLQYQDDLLGSWQALTNFAARETDYTNRVLVSPQSSPRQFLRVIVNGPPEQ